MSMAETHWTRLSSWQILFIAFGLLSWLFYLGLSWIASLPFFVQILFGATTGLVFMASYFNTQILRSQHRRRIAVNLAQLSTVDMVALQRLMPNHEKALSWVPNTSDVELVRWINAGLTKAWPYLKEASSSTLMVDLEKVCNKYKSGAIEAIKIKNLNLGKFCPYVEGVKAFRNGENKQICLEIQVDWRENGDQEILINVLTSESEYEVQVKDFIFYCVLRLTFTHLTEEFPCFAAVTFSIVEPPLIDFQSKLVSGDAKKILGMEKAVDNLLLEAFMDHFVWPSRVIVPVIPGDYRDLEASSVGQLHIHLIEAENLANKEVSGRSYPYVMLFVRRRIDLVKESSQMSDTADPIWNEEFLFNVEDTEAQKLTIKLMNMNEDNTSVFVGIAELQICQLKENIVEDMWIDLVGDPAKLHGKSAGKIHLLVEFRPLSSTDDKDTDNAACRESTISASISNNPIYYLNNKIKKSEPTEQGKSFGNAKGDWASSDGLKIFLDGNAGSHENEQVQPLILPEGNVTMPYSDEKIPVSCDIDACNLQPENEEDSAGYGKQTTLLSSQEESCSEGVIRHSNRMNEYPVGIFPEENISSYAEKSYHDGVIAHSGRINGCHGSIFPEELNDTSVSGEGDCLQIPNEQKVDLGDQASRSISIEETDSDEGPVTGFNSNEPIGSVLSEEHVILRQSDDSDASSNENSTHKNADMSEPCKNKQNTGVPNETALGSSGTSLEGFKPFLITEEMFSSEIFEVD